MARARECDTVFIFRIKTDSGVDSEFACVYVCVYVISFKYILLKIKYLFYIHRTWKYILL